MTEPTDWCSVLSIVPKKNGKLRLCVDLRKLNQSVKCESYTLSTNDFLPSLSKSKFYSVPDTSRGYWQIPLSSESVKLTTFIMHRRHYNFYKTPLRNL